MGYEFRARARWAERRGGVCEEGGQEVEGEGGKGLEEGVEGFGTGGGW